MNKETYEAVKLIQIHIKHFANDKYPSEHLVHKAIKQVDGWAEEVAKEYTN